MTITLTAQLRDAKADLQALREEGLVPAVYYGQGKDAVAIALNHQEMVKAYQDAGQSTLITLTTPEQSEQVLIHDIDIHPVSHKLRHVDFLVVDTSKPIQVAVPLEFIGVAPAEKDGLGILNKALEEIEIEVLATELPSHIDVSLESLATLEDSIYAQDITIPASATLLTDAEALVAKVSEQKEEAEEASAEMDLDAIQSDTGNAKEESASEE